MVNYGDCRHKKNPMIVGETKYEYTLIFKNIIDSFLVMVVGSTLATLPIHSVNALDNHV